MASVHEPNLKTENVSIPPPIKSSPLKETECPQPENCKIQWVRKTDLLKITVQGQQFYKTLEQKLLEKGMMGMSEIEKDLFLVLRVYQIMLNKSITFNTVEFMIHALLVANSVHGRKTDQQLENEQFDKRYLSAMTSCHDCGYLVLC